MAVVDGLLVDVRDRVGYVTIDRPERRNAMSQAISEALVEVFDDLDADPSVWVVLITGAGDQAFSAGRDLKEIAERDAADDRPFQPMRGTSRNAFEAVYECRKPVVAAINGWAVGGGLELALACDLRIAVRGAQLAMSEAKRGMGANFGSNLLPRMVPLGVAYEMLYFGEPVSAETAAGWGLVNVVVDPDRFREESERYVREILKRAPLTQRRYKAMIQKGLSLPLQAALRLDPSPNPYVSEDRIEGVRAFNEKREPQWNAR